LAVGGPDPDSRRLLRRRTFRGPPVIDAIFLGFAAIVTLAGIVGMVWSMSR
jgi:hypothetical protein